MSTAPMVLTAVFAAFCIWIIVRLVNRQKMDRKQALRDLPQALRNFAYVLGGIFLGICIGYQANDNIVESAIWFFGAGTLSIVLLIVARFLPSDSDVKPPAKNPDAKPESN